MSVKKLYTEKLRPKKLEQIILLNRIRNLIGDGELTGHFLFAGSAGLGKTSLARILAQPFSNMYINVSDESSVDVIREKIKDFITTNSLELFNDVEEVENSTYRVVIFDEFDGASQQFYKALRVVWKMKDITMFDILLAVIT